MPKKRIDFCGLEGHFFLIWLHIERKNEREFALALTDFGCARAQRSPMRIWAPLALRPNERRSSEQRKWDVFQI